MAYVSEPPVVPGASSIQDVFLNGARRDRLVVNVQLLDGRQFDGRIKNFDKFAIVVEIDGADCLIFKHAIATLATGRALASYLPPARA